MCIYVCNSIHKNDAMNLKESLENGYEKVWRNNKKGEMMQLYYNFKNRNC